MIVEAKIEKKSFHPGGIVHILLTDVVVDGDPWRDHAWVKWSKRWEGFRRGDKVRFNAVFKPKFNSQTLKWDSKRLGTVRNIELVK